MEKGTASLASGSTSSASTTSKTVAEIQVQNKVVKIAEESNLSGSGVLKEPRYPCSSLRFRDTATSDAARAARIASKAPTLAFSVLLQERPGVVSVTPL